MPSIFDHKYPYTNFEELNLDWFLTEFKNLLSHQDTVDNHIQDLDEMVHEFTDFVTNYFSNLDVQNEINNKLDEMAADGTLTDLITPIFYEYQTEVRVLSERLSQAESDLTVDSELQDIRVGYDGHSYLSAGDAVRGQIELFRDQITNIIPFSLQTGKWFGGTVGGTVAENIDAGSSYTVIDLSAYVGKKVVVHFYNTSSISARGTMLCNSSGKIANKIMQKEMPARGWIILVDSEYNQLYVSFDSNSANSLTVFSAGEMLSSGVDYVPVYVSTAGDDATATGSYDAPYATVTKALSDGHRNIHVLGGVYDQQINCSGVSGDVYITAHEPNKRVIFFPAAAVIASSETLHSGIVYKASSSAIASQIRWLYQDGVPDADTLIDNTERLPQQRGRIYRCEDTKIEKCTSNNLTDAISEIESASGYKWYYDSGTLYYSRPSAVSSSNPICKGTTENLFLNVGRGVTMHITAIESKYRRFNVDGTIGSKIVDCISSNVFGEGAFKYDECTGVTFVRCEAARCQTSGSGDGFNGHCYPAASDDSFPHQSTAIFVECWSHDNMDDGYSDHERSETIIYGGLYEYNGKGGVTPSYGSHCTAHGTVCRHNWNGFTVVGNANPSEGGYETQLLCVSCVSVYNNVSSTKYGFNASDTSGAHNRIICVNCVSYGNGIGYHAGTNATATLYNCQTGGGETSKSGSVTVVNTTSVT